MMDALAFLIEAEELGLLTELPPQTIPAKGHCRHCGKPVGRGIWRHEKACAGKP